MKCDVCNTVYTASNGGTNGGTNGNTNADVTPVGSVLAFPQSNVSNNGTRFHATGLAQGVYYAFGGAAAAGPKRLSWSIDSGGYPCYQTFDLNVPSPAHTGGTPWVNAPADGSDWTYYVMFTADLGRVQDGHIDMLDA
jgi:hypothetical protein